MIRKLFFLLIFFLVLTGSKSFAHPHVFLDAYIKIVFEEDQIKQLKIQFDFDQMFSADLIKSFDTDSSGQFENHEIDSLYANAFGALQSSNYLLHVYDDEQSLNFNSAHSFKASINEKGAVVYNFTIDTDIPTNIKNKKLKIALFDESYFTDVFITQENFSFENEGQAKFEWEVIEDESQAFYFEQLFPYTAILTFK